MKKTYLIELIVCFFAVHDLPASGSPKYAEWKFFYSVRELPNL